MRHRPSLPLAAAILLAMLAAGGAAAADREPARGNVYDYAVENPVDDSPLPIAPTLGETVPRTVSLVPPSDNSTYAYFYYEGHPVIVDMTTRSVVRVGK